MSVDLNNRSSYRTSVFFSPLSKMPLQQFYCNHRNRIIECRYTSSVYEPETASPIAESFEEQSSRVQINNHPNTYL